MLLVEGENPTHYMIVFPMSIDELKFYETHDTGTTFKAGKIVRPNNKAFAQAAIGGSVIFTGDTNSHILMYTWDSTDVITEKNNFGLTDGIFDPNWNLIVYFPEYKFIINRGLNSSAEVFGWDTGTKAIKAEFETSYAGLAGTLGFVEPVFVNDKMYIYQEDILVAGNSVKVIGEMDYVYPGSTVTTTHLNLNNDTVTSMAALADGIMFTQANGKIYFVKNIAGSTKLSSTITLAGGNWVLYQRRPDVYEETQNPPVYAVND
jgi:hypothetical protein